MLKVEKWKGTGKESRKEGCTDELIEWEVLKFHVDLKQPDLWLHISAYDRSAFVMGMLWAGDPGLWLILGWFDNVGNWCRLHLVWVCNISLQKSHPAPLWAEMENVVGYTFSTFFFASVAFPLWDVEGLPPRTSDPLPASWALLLSWGFMDQTAFCFSY